MLYNYYPGRDDIGLDMALNIFQDTFKIIVNEINIVSVAQQS